MANWTSANMGGFLPPEVQTLTSTASSTAGAAAGVLGAIKAAVDAAKLFLTNFPAFDFLQGLDIAVQQFRDDFLATGLYSSLMWDYPLVQLLRSGSGGEDFSRFIDDLANSFTDGSDPNVPPFSSDTAMLVLVGGVPGIPGVLESLNAVAAAFSWWEELDESRKGLQKKADDEQLRTVQEAIFGREIRFFDNPAKQTEQGQEFQRARRDARELLESDVVKALNKPTTGSSPAEIVAFINSVNSLVAASNYPDWQQISLRTINPAIVDVVDQAFDPLVATLAAGRSVLDNAVALADNLSAKIDALNAVVAAITQFIQQLNGVIALTNLSALFISTPNGVTDLASELRSAGNIPYSGNNFYYGAAFVAGGASVTPFTNLFGPVGGF